MDMPRYNITDLNMKVLDNEVCTEASYSDEV